MLSVINPECCKRAFCAELRYSECGYTECHYAEIHGANTRATEREDFTFSKQPNLT
jgi:hypothetical protein